MKRFIMLLLAAGFLAAGIVILSACRGGKPSHAQAAEDQRNIEIRRQAGAGLTEPKTDTIFGITQYDIATPSIEGAEAIASVEAGELGGVTQWITIRSQDVSHPVLLWLHGGPGLTEIPYMSLHRELESRFVVVNWDQRGAGKSFDRRQDCKDMTLDRLVEDARELVSYLVGRFDKEKVYLLGHSWGAMIGMLLADRYPGLIHAFVSVGQPVHYHREEEISLDFVIEAADRLGLAEAQRELAGISYPYRSRDEQLVQRKWLLVFGGMIWKKQQLVDCVFDPRSCYTVPEYTEEDWDGRARGLSASYGCLAEEIEEFDLFRLVDALEIPVYFFLGAHDYQVPFPASVEYFERLEAPHKEIVWFRESAHYPQLEETEKFHSLIIEKLLSGGS